MRSPQFEPGSLRSEQEAYSSRMDGHGGHGGDDEDLRETLLNRQNLH